MKTEHTPTPWTVNGKHEFNEHGACGFNIDSESGSTVSLATTWGDDEHDKTARANAALIVRAVNNHEKLVKALKGLHEFASLYGASERTSLEDWSGHLIAAEEALKQATE